MEQLEKRVVVSRETLEGEMQNFLGEVERQRPEFLLPGFPELEMKQLGLYPVVESIKVIEQLLKCGVKIIQLRIKNPESPGLEEMVMQAVSLGREYSAQIFINDYWELSIKHKAFGVHLGQEDLYDADLNALRESGVRLGISTHSYEELLVALKVRPSYIALGHIFPTITKKMPSKPQGIERLNYYQKTINLVNRSLGLSIPTVAIGGIDLSNVDDVLSCGVNGVAVVRAITEAESIALVVDAFSQRIECAQSGEVCYGTD